MSNEIKSLTHDELQADNPNKTIILAEERYESNDKVTLPCGDEVILNQHKHCTFFINEDEWNIPGIFDDYFQLIKKSVNESIKALANNTVVIAIPKINKESKGLEHLESAEEDGVLLRYICNEAQNGQKVKIFSYSYLLGEK